MEKQLENDANWRYLLADGVLSILLPTEDLENDCLRKLLTEVLADIVLGNFIGGIASQPMFIWDGITKMAELVANDGQNRDEEDEEMAKKKLSASGKLEQFGLLDPVGLDEEDEARREEVTRSFMGKMMAHASRFCWLGMYMIYIGYIIFRAAVVTLATSSSLARRLSWQGHSRDGQRRQDNDKDYQEADKRIREQSELKSATDIEKNEHGSGNDERSTHHRPIVEMRIWSCIGRLLDVESVMPWAGGLAALVQWMAVHGPGRVGDVDGLLDL